MNQCTMFQCNLTHLKQVSVVSTLISNPVITPPINEPPIYPTVCLFKCEICTGNASHVLFNSQFVLVGQDLLNSKAFPLIVIEAPSVVIIHSCKRSNTVVAVIVPFGSE